MSKERELGEHATWPRRTTALGAVGGIVLVITGLLAGCLAAEVEVGIEDGQDARFLTAGKADAAGIAEGTAEAVGVLRVANESSRAVLIDEVGLTMRATDAILAYRVGDDEQVDTSDDEEFSTLEELDAVPFIGPQALAALLAYAIDNGFVPDCVSVCVDDTHLLDCAAGGAVVACPLGCADAICQAFAPSNLVPESVRDEYMQGVTASLTVPVGGLLEIDVDTGYIYNKSGTMLRPPPVGARWGAPVYGVADGIGFYDYDGMRVIVVKELKVGKGGYLRLGAFDYDDYLGGDDHLDNSPYPGGLLGWYAEAAKRLYRRTTPSARGVIILSLGPVTVNGRISAAASIKTWWNDTTENNGVDYTAGIGGPGALGGVGTTSEAGWGVDCVGGSRPVYVRPTGGGYGQAPAYGRPNLVPLLPGSGRRYGSQPAPYLPAFCQSGGGGALEIVSLRAIEVAATGGLGYAVIDAGGALGGSGGAILLEAPQVRIGPGGVVATNGGGAAAVAAVLPTDPPNGGGTLITTPTAGGGGFGRIRINAGPDALDLQGAYISPLPSLGTPSLRTESDVVLEDYTGRWGAGASGLVARKVGGHVRAVEGTRRYVGRLEFGILKGWWTQLPTRRPDVDAGEFECTVPSVMQRRMTCKRRPGTNGAWVAMPTTYLGEALQGELDASFNDEASFIPHPWWN